MREVENFQLYGEFMWAWHGEGERERDERNGKCRIKFINYSPCSVEYRGEYLYEKNYLM